MGTDTRNSWNVAFQVIIKNVREMSQVKRVYLFLVKNPSILQAAVHNRFITIPPFRQKV